MFLQVSCRGFSVQNGSIKRTPAFSSKGLPNTRLSKSLELTGSPKESGTSSSLAPSSRSLLVLTFGMVPCLCCFSPYHCCFFVLFIVSSFSFFLFLLFLLVSLLIHLVLLVLLVLILVFRRVLLFDLAVVLHFSVCSFFFGCNHVYCLFRLIVRTSCLLTSSMYKPSMRFVPKIHMRTTYVEGTLVVLRQWH